MRSGCNNVIWGRKTVEWSFRGPQSPRTQPSASVILQNACCEKAALRQAAWKVLPLRVYVPFWSDSSSASEAMQDTVLRHAICNRRRCRRDIYDVTHSKQEPRRLASGAQGEVGVVPTENSVWSCKAHVTMLHGCLRKPPPVTFDLNVADSQAPSQR